MNFAIDIDHHTRRHGPNWVAWIGATEMLVVTDDSDEESGVSAIADLGSWTNPADWTAVESGWLNDGSTYHVLSWEPQMSRVGNDKNGTLV